MRDARFVSLTDDGQGLVLEHEGRHLRLPLDARVRAALSGEAQMPMPLETRVTPREIQHRLRCGETASAIAAAAGVGVELIARFEGPVVAERDWHVVQAQKTEIDEVALRDRVAGVVSRAGGDPDAVEWVAWLTDDTGWRVQASLPDGRVAAWAWDPRTHRLRSRDDLARVISSGDAADDDLDAVLRPVATAREAERAAATVVALRPVDASAAHVGPARAFEDEPLPDAEEAMESTVDAEAPGEAAAAVDSEDAEASVDAEAAVDAEVAEASLDADAAEAAADAESAAPVGDAAVGRAETAATSGGAGATADDAVAEEGRSRPVAASAKKRRASVPSWDEILMGSTKRRDD